MGKQELNRVRKIVLEFPEVNERLSHGAICFFIQNKTPVCYFHDNHRSDNRISIWCPAFADVQEDLTHFQPKQFFKPETGAGGQFEGWIGTYLDTTDENGVDWKQIRRVLELAYKKVAPKRLIAEMERE